jgi:hypothetical protein
MMAVGQSIALKPPQAASVRNPNSAARLVLAAGALLTLAAAGGPVGRIPVAIGSVLMGLAWVGMGRRLLRGDSRD